jgi:hypothetical protein
MLVRLILILFVLKKATSLVPKVLHKYIGNLGEEHLYEIGVLTLLSFITILLLCYGFGYLSEWKRIKPWLGSLSDMPGNFTSVFRFMKIWASKKVEGLYANHKLVTLCHDGKGR